MDDSAEGRARLLAGRYRLPPARDDAGRAPFPSADHGVPAYDTASGQRVLVRKVPLPEVVDAEVVDAEAGPRTDSAPRAARGPGREGPGATAPADPSVRRALQAASAPLRLPDHPRLAQVFDAFVEGDGLWVVGEFVPGTPLADLLARRTLTPHRAAEVASDLLSALRLLHAHGWTHGNVTARTVVVCDGGEAMLTGLAVGAAQEALCGNDPLPHPAAYGSAHESPGEERDTAAAVAGEDAGESGGGGAQGSARGGALAEYGAGASGARRAVSAVPDDDVRWLPAGGEVAQVPPPRAPHRGAPERPSTGGAEQRNRPREPGRSGGGWGGTRVRQARMAVVGAVTERWAPEQARSEPVGPAADLWALGVLLFRAVRGRAPYPEEDAGELADLVAGRRPPGADGCGPLRPLVESLLRREPAERPGHGELAVRLRALARQAPEPEVGRNTVTAPAVRSSGPADPRRLPILRRRGELVRRRRARGRRTPTERRRGPDSNDGPGDGLHDGPPDGPGDRRGGAAGGAAPGAMSSAAGEAGDTTDASASASASGGTAAEAEAAGRSSRAVLPAPGALSLVPPPEWGPPKPRAPGRPPPPPSSPPSSSAALSVAGPSPPPSPSSLLPPSPPRPQAPPTRRRAGVWRVERGLGVPVALAVALLCALWLLPRAVPDGSVDPRVRQDRQGPQGRQERGSLGDRPRHPAPPPPSAPDSASSPSTAPATKAPPPSAPASAPSGYRLRRDRAGFEVAVPAGWERRSGDGRRQVRYDGGALTMVVAAGRDTTARYGADPMAYQGDHEPELARYRDADWASASRLRQAEEGGRPLAEGAFSWREGGARRYARNRVVIVQGRYHLLLVAGPQSRAGEIDRRFEAAVGTYRAVPR